MNPNQTDAYKYLGLAQQARKAGNKHLARQYAERAARLAPEIEDVWLMMAALASPRASVVFMERALQINPQSERVRQGMHWAVERLRKEPVRRQVYAAVATQPALVRKPVTRSRFSYAAVLLTVACLMVVWAIWNVTPAAASFINSSLFTSEQNVPAWAPVDVAKPTYTLTSLPAATATVAPSATPTFAYTPTETAVPVAIASPLGTDAPTETATLIASDTPTITPTESASPTPLTTDTVYPSPTPLATDIIEASPTPLPTDTDVPGLPTRAIPPPLPNNGGGKGGTRWVDVDLTHQMVYAYEGNTVVNSFLVSTGTWLHPTVTGQYHVYIKYRYKDMSGPGYFLPNVPHTMFFYQGYALHGTYWHSNFGTPMSHGCVNLSLPDAEWLYNWASVGTLVNIHY